jgi:hypothetical protein
LKVNKVNFLVSSVLFVFWYCSPNFLDTPRMMYSTSYNAMWSSLEQTWCWSGYVLICWLTRMRLVSMSRTVMHRWNVITQEWRNIHIKEGFSILDRGCMALHVVFCDRYRCLLWARMAQSV